MRPARSIAILLAAALPTPATAAEIYGGVMAHGMNTPLTKDIHERGTDFELGWRGAPILPLGFLGGPRPYVFGSVNGRKGGTDFAAAGLSWRIGTPFYVRPGIGIAVHDGPSYRDDGRYRTDLGSRVLFEPELSIGTTLLPNVSLEASWVHISHAQIFGRQNPGLDTIGLRAAVRIP